MRSKNFSFTLDHVARYGQAFLVTHHSTPFWKDGCSHGDRCYAGSFRLTLKDLGTAETLKESRMDVYVHVWMGTQEVCARYGDEGSQYCSIGTPFDLLYGLFNTARGEGVDDETYRFHLAERQEVLEAVFRGGVFTWNQGGKDSTEALNKKVAYLEAQLARSEKIIHEWQDTYQSMLRYDQCHGNTLQLETELQDLRHLRDDAEARMNSVAAVTAEIVSHKLWKQFLEDLDEDYEGWVEVVHQIAAWGTVLENEFPGPDWDGDWYHVLEDYANAILTYCIAMQRSPTTEEYTRMARLSWEKGRFNGDDYPDPDNYEDLDDDGKGYTDDDCLVDSIDLEYDDNPNDD